MLPQNWIHFTAGIGLQDIIIQQLVRYPEVAMVVKVELLDLKLCFFVYRTKKPMGALGALSMCHNVRRNDILDFKFYSILQSNSLVYY